MVLQEAAQPRDGVGVEVVGRLVEQQRGVGLPGAVGGGEQDSRELDASALTTREGAERLVEHAVRQAQAVADAGGLGLGDIAAESGEALLEAAVAGDGLVAHLVVDGLGHQGLLLLHVAQDLVESARGEHPILGEDVEVALLGILRQVTEFARAADGARVGLRLAGQDAQGGGLAGAVAAH